MSGFILGSATIGKLMHLLVSNIFEISMYEFLGLVDTVIILEWVVRDDKDMFFYQSRISFSATDAIYCFHCMSMQNSYMQKDFGGIKKLRLNLVLLPTCVSFRIIMNTYHTIHGQVVKQTVQLFSLSSCHETVAHVPL